MAGWLILMCSVLEIYIYIYIVSIYIELKTSSAFTSTSDIALEERLDYYSLDTKWTGIICMWLITHMHNIILIF